MFWSILKAVRLPSLQCSYTTRPHEVRRTKSPSRTPPRQVPSTVSISPDTPGLGHVIKGCAHHEEVRFESVSMAKSCFSNTIHAQLNQANAKGE